MATARSDQIAWEMSLAISTRDSFPKLPPVRSTLARSALATIMQGWCQQWSASAVTVKVGGFVGPTQPQNLRTKMPLSGLAASSATSRVSHRSSAVNKFSPIFFHYPRKNRPRKSCIRASLNSPDQRATGLFVGSLRRCMITAGGTSSLLA